MNLFKYRPDHTTSIECHTQRSSRRRRTIVAFVGALGSILGIKTLIALRQLNAETHLVISKRAEVTINHEIGYTISKIQAFVDHVYTINDMAAPIASR